ncbi:MAG TPA: adenylate/guanylate cyclase domain-containing protein [Gallionella sp.]|nr:adenylate/guanylate cyclase domain-containing protein [Gallionella sp.]
MEDRGNKTIMCSVLFLDIVEYSKMSVTGQISLKDRFNSYLSAAISSVPIADRIILDTGDGAAINFLGDVEDALKAALSLRESILNEGPHQDPPLLVRAGINLGPVRLVRDINGQPNIVGDGINVAQRIMGFAEADQILVSRSYYDAVSRLSPQYAGMFHFQGSRTDKHVREHEVYAIGHLGERTADLIATNLHEVQKNELFARFVASVRGSWNAIISKSGSTIKNLKSRFEQADRRQRAIYAGAVAIPVVLIGVLVLKLAHKGEAPALPRPSIDQVQAASGIQPVSAVASVVPAAPHAESKAAGTGSKAVAQPDTKKSAEGKTGSKKAGDQVKHPAAQPKAKEPASTDKKTWLETIKGSAERGTEAYISIICKKGAQLFVDGALKGKVIEKGLKVEVSPGKHAVIVSSATGILHKQDVDLEPGKTVQVKPNFCD